MAGMARRGGGEELPPDAPRRRWRRFLGLSPLALLGFGAVALVAVVSFVVTRGMVQTEHRDGLEERADAVNANVTAGVSTVRSSFRSLGAAMQQGPEQFDTAAAALAASGAAAVAVVDTTTSPPTVVEAVGPGLAVGDPLPPEAVDALATLSVEQPFASADVLSTDGTRRIGFVQGPPTSPSGLAFYIELALMSFDPAQVQSVLNPAPDVDAALYASDSPDDDQLLWSTTSALPLTGGTVVETVPAGSSSWLLVVDANGSLAEPLARAVPWILLVAGLVSALLAGIAIEMVTRRRDRALLVAGNRERENLSILEAAGEAFISIDADGSITQWNGHAERLFGWDAAEAIGLKVVDTIVPPEHRAAHNAGMARFVSSGEGPLLRNRLEVEALARDGRRFPVEVFIWPTPDEEGRVASALLHDISERRRAADELASAHIAALEASRLKSEFLANMSHEIRTPMNGVIGMSGLLLRTDLDEDQREFAETIRTSAESLLTVINDILDFSKIEAGKLQLEVSDFEPSDVMEEAAELLAERAHAKGVEVAVAVDEDVPVVVGGDAGRLRQVLLNLLSNAIKFTETGEVVMRCSVVEGGTTGSRLRFEIRDTGIGISPEDHHRVFDSFTQLDGSSTRLHQGTGLGLSIARQLVALMGGTIGLDSTLGVGSTFWFTIEVERRDASSLPDRAPRADLRGVRVLVVDDNETNRTILTRTLSSWGMRPSDVPGAVLALEVLRAAAATNDPYRVVLLDFHMPEVDGVELARRITAEPALRGTVLLLLTSAVDAVGQQVLTAAGIVSSLNKPVRLQLLHDRVAAGLSAQQEADAGRVAVAAPVDDAPLGARVLVAEDNPVNQRVAARMLERIGCSVDVVGDGAEALEALARQHYDVVFMDCQMPVKDGYETTREIRRVEAATGSPRKPVVAMTAAAMRGDEQRALDVGMDDYLSKPVRLDDLAAMVRRWTLGRGAAAPVAAPEPPPRDDVIDRFVLRELRDTMATTDDRGLTAILESFVRNATDQLATMEQAAAREELGAAATTAHSLRGAASALGARQVASSCALVEGAARNADPAAVSEAVVAVDAALTEAVAALRAIVDG